jgi:hypothetical protein
MLYLIIIKNTNKMELLKHEVHSQVIENTYTIQHPTEGVLVYKEWIDSNGGKCIDYVLRDKDGYEIDDAALMMEVQYFVDDLGSGPGMFIDDDEWEKEMGR